MLRSGLKRQFVWMGYLKVLARLLDLTFDPSLVDIQMLVVGTIYVFFGGAVMILFYCGMFLLHIL